MIQITFSKYKAKKKIMGVDIFFFFNNTATMINYKFVNH